MSEEEQEMVGTGMYCVSLNLPKLIYTVDRFIVFFTPSTTTTGWAASGIHVCINMASRIGPN